MGVKKRKTVTRKKGILNNLEALNSASFNEKKHTEFVEFLNAKDKTLSKEPQSSLKVEQNNKVIFLLVVF